MRESHCNPEEAVRIFQDLVAGQAIGVHCGTFKLTLEPLAELPQRLRAVLQEVGFRLTVSALSHMASAGICNPGQLLQSAGCRGNLSPQNHPVWLAFGPSLNYSNVGFLRGSGEPGA